MIRREAVLLETHFICDMYVTNKTSEMPVTSNYRVQISIKMRMYKGGVSCEVSICISMLMTFHEKYVKRIVYDGTRTRNLPLRRRTPYPLGHADTISIISNTHDHITFTIHSNRIPYHLSHVCIWFFKIPSPWVHGIPVIA